MDKDSTSNDELTDAEMSRRRKSIRPLTERIKELREESVNSEVKISTERAELVTEFYREKNTEGSSTKKQRALMFKYLMENVSIPVEKDQLIVGIRGTGPKEVPTYPEVCCHDEEDLDLLDSREKNPYKTTQKEKMIYEKDIIPFWEDKTIRNKIFDEMTEEWMEAYHAGIFTEFMEQRTPGHTAGGKRIFACGLREIIEEISNSMKNIRDDEKIEELESMKIAAEGMITYAERYSEKLKKMAEKESDDKRRRELEKMSDICKHVPANPPKTFWEALQHYWFIHVGVVYESNPWDSFNPGRLDQHLFPFYQREKEEGTIDKMRAKELLEAFWLKFNNHPSPPKVGVTAEESNTYNDFTKINIGGVKNDGTDGVDELSYLLLEVLDEMRTLQPNTAVLISDKTPDKFLDRSMEVVSPGFGEPPFFNNDVMIDILLRQGKSLVDAREGGVSGCVETGAFGRESYILTGYFNLPKVLEITLNDGIDPKNGKKIGLETSQDHKDFQSFYKAFKKQLEHFIDIKMEGNDIIERIYDEEIPVPFLSLWIEDCVDEGRDYNGGGARYNTQYIQIVGLGTLADSLASLKYNVFDEEKYDMDIVLEALNSDYNGQEKMRQVFLNKTPKYGNDDDYADDIAVDVFRTCIDMVEGYDPTPIRKASRRVYGLPTTVHVYFGRKCTASPDGRKASEPLSEGISPVQGADREGISSVFLSVGKLDHVKSGGTLLNQKLSPDLLSDQEIRKKIAQLIRSYFAMGSHHVQFNVISKGLLERALEEPRRFQDLMVRVAGYSDYFINLPKGLQEEIIKRTEQGL